MNPVDTNPEKKSRKKRAPNRERNLSVIKRHIQITTLILSDPLNMNAIFISEKLGVSLSTAKRDIQDPILRQTLRDALYDFASSELIQSAMNNITTAVEDGDPDVSKWLLEKIGFFPPEQLRIMGPEAAPVESTEEEVAKQVDALFENTSD